MKPHKPIKRGEFLIYKEMCLGEGTFAKTYKATHISNQQQFYACKTIDKAQFNCLDEQKKIYFIGRLQEEVKAWKELQHSNIVRFYNFLETANTIYMILQFCPHGTLEDYLKNRHALPPKEALDLGKQIVSACSYLYTKAIVHRDIKPANLLIKDKTVKISDFGLAKLLNTEELNELKTGTVAGSPCYMAPEVLKGEKYSISCDVWSVGVILYRMFTGRMPWMVDKVQSEMKMLMVLNEQSIQFPKSVPVEVQGLIRKTLELDCTKRINMKEVETLINCIQLA